MNRRIDDFEEGLSRLVGDVAAHQVGRALRGVAGWGEQARHTLAMNVKEYLQEETRDLVPRPELEGFNAEVTALEHAVNELEARIATLKGTAAR